MQGGNATSGEEKTEVTTHKWHNYGATGNRLIYHTQLPGIVMKQHQLPSMTSGNVSWQHNQFNSHAILEEMQKEMYINI